MQFFVLAALVASAVAVPSTLIGHGAVVSQVVAAPVIAAVPAATTYHTQKSYLAPVGTQVDTHVQPGLTQVVKTVAAAPVLSHGPAVVGAPLLAGHGAVLGGLDGHGAVLGGAVLNGGLAGHGGVLAGGHGGLLH